MRINSIDYIKIQKYIILSFFKKKLWNNIILNLFKLIFATHNLGGLGLITISFASSLEQDDRSSMPLSWNDKSE
jgi:hypothetical protein